MFGRGGVVKGRNRFFHKEFKDFYFHFSVVRERDMHVLVFFLFANTGIYMLRDSYSCRSVGPSLALQKFRWTTWELQCHPSKDIHTIFSDSGSYRPAAWVV